MKWISVITSVLLLLVLAVNWSLAINCYICDSSDNPKCENLTDRAIKPETCTYEKLVSDGSGNRISWLMSVSELHYFHEGSAVEIPMVCQKIVGIDENQQTTTLRRCQLQDVKPCDFARNQVFKTGQKEIKFCEVCDTDNCNGAIARSPSGAIGLTVALAVAVAWVAVGRV